MNKENARGIDRDRVSPKKGKLEDAVWGPRKGWVTRGTKKKQRPPRPPPSLLPMPYLLTSAQQRPLTTTKMTITMTITMTV